jgi:16S rRNA (cytidine1402-2'-O)-methyltransferase
MLFYETGRRLAASLADMAQAFGARPAAFGRELTKLHEEIVRGDLVTLAARVRTLEVKGEVIVGVSGAPSPAPRVEQEDLEAEIRRRRAAGASVRDIAAALASEHGLSRRDVYRLALALQDVES